MKIKTQSGFTVVEVLLIVLVLAVIGFGGYLVWHKQHDKTKTTAATTVSAKSSTVTKSASTPKNSNNQEALTQTYTNTDFGYTFNYPADWKLSTDLEDAGRGAPEGTVAVVSPNGTTVHFDPNFGGKGGDCWDDQANAHTTRTCTTRDILTVSKLTDSGSEPIWLIHASDTAPTDQGGGTTYFIYLSSADYDSATGNFDAAPVTGSNLGAFLGTYDDVQLSKGSVSVSVEGSEDSQNTSNAFFSTKEVQEATPVLESFKAS